MRIIDREKLVYGRMFNKNGPLCHERKYVCVRNKISKESAAVCLVFRHRKHIAENL